MCMCMARTRRKNVISLINVSPYESWTILNELFYADEAAQFDRFDDIRSSLHIRRHGGIGELNTLF